MRLRGARGENGLQRDRFDGGMNGEFGVTHGLRPFGRRVEGRVISRRHDEVCYDAGHGTGVDFIKVHTSLPTGDIEHLSEGFAIRCLDISRSLDRRDIRMIRIRALNLERFCPLILFHTKHPPDIIPATPDKLDNDVQCYTNSSRHPCTVPLLYMIFRGSEGTSTTLDAKSEAKTRMTTITATDTVGMQLSDTMGELKHRF